MTSQLDSFLGCFNSGHFVVNAKREISFSNQYMVNHLGWSQEALSEMSLSDIFSRASNIFIDSYVYPLLINEHCAEELQLTLITAKGNKVAVVANIRLDEYQTTYWSLFDCANRDKLYQELIHAKELLEKQGEELLEMATVDALTGLLNRRELDNRVRRLLSQAQRNKSSVAVIIIDIDFFKVINDTKGHAFGDDVLQHLGEVLLKRHREHDILARYGGEEFVLVLPDVNEENAFKVAEAIRVDIETTNFKGIGITVSIGVSLNKEDNNEFDILFKEADSALYIAKKGGRNKSVLFEPSFLKPAIK
jgi:diguanylate cyclase (GGDEF)-like protein